MSERIDNIAKAHEVAHAVNKVFDDNVARDKAIATLATLREHGLAEEWFIEPLRNYVARQLIEKAIDGKDFGDYIRGETSEPYGLSYSRSWEYGGNASEMNAVNELAGWIYDGVETPEHRDLAQEMETASDNAALHYDGRVKRLRRSAAELDLHAGIVDIWAELIGQKLA